MIHAEDMPTLGSKKLEEQAWRESLSQSDSQIELEESPYWAQGGRRLCTDTGCRRLLITVAYCKGPAKLSAGLSNKMQ